MEIQSELCKETVSMVSKKPDTDSFKVLYKPTDAAERKLGGSSENSASPDENNWNKMGSSRIKWTTVVHHRTSYLQALRRLVKST